MLYNFSAFSFPVINYSPFFSYHISNILKLLYTSQGEIEDFAHIKNPTEKQTQRINDLIYKRDNPELSETVKSYCEDWLKSQLYNRKLEFTSKYTEKGLIVEDNSIDFISEKLGLGLLFKNEKYYENDYLTGTDDIEIPDLVISYY